MSEINQADQFPSLRYTSRSTYTFTTGTTQTITDANVKADSIILIMQKTIPVGHWSITVSAGSFLITSSDAETSATFKYVIL